MFAHDRDLLALEPDLFRDVGWVGQRLLVGLGTIAGTTLTLTSHDVDLVDAGVAEGFVAIVGETPLEVVEVLGATEATVSRVRAGMDDALIVPPAVVDAPVVVPTLRPQLSIVHGQVLRLLGIEPSEPPAPGRVGEGDITNPRALATLEALGALHLTFTAAAALSPPGSSLWHRAGVYRERFARERRVAAAMIDTDGDGLADATRRLNVMPIVRV